MTSDGDAAGADHPAPVRVRDVFAVLRLLRAPAGCTVAAVLALALPEQTHEIIRALAQRILLPYREWAPWLEFGLAVAGLLVLALTVWWVARQLAVRQPAAVAPGARRVLDPVARGLVFAVFAGATLALWWAQTPAPDAETRDAVLAALRREFPRLHSDALQGAMQTLFSFNKALTYAAIATAIIGSALVAMLPDIASAKPRRAVDGHSLFGRTTTAITYGLVAAVILLFVAAPVAAANASGALAILFAFLACSTLLLAQVSYWSDRHGIPYGIVLVAWIVGVSILDLNDNHAIYRSAPPVAAEGPAKRPGSGSEPTELATAFASWWEKRPDKAVYAQRGQPYPVYVVAAQGGGIYAAFHTASILSGLQDDCPAFAHHLFAISSVSGGSIGAAAFAGLVKQTEAEALAGAVAKPCRDAERPYRQSMVDLADTMLSEDLLAPLLGATLFPDLLQQVLPFPVPPFDRALHFEKAFERSMEVATGRLATSRTRKDRAVGPNFIASRYADHWTAGGSTPALVINTTEVGSGRRRVIAPFEFARDELLFVPVAAAFPEGSRAARIRDLPVSTAAGLSARFPWLTPAGSFLEHARDPRTGEARRNAPMTKVRVVDGAYFENSGVATALDLMRSMEAAARSAPQPFAEKIRIRLIVLTRGGYPSQTFYGLGEAISPIQALLNTQTSRAYITIAEAERQLNTLATPGAQAQGAPPQRLHKINLLDLGYPPPLGWHLSPITMFLIKAQNGLSGACKAQPGEADRRLGRFRSEADGDCLLHDIARELKGE